ncbi:MAG: prolyl aminopeptidase [Pseudomonadota bacterium]
MDRAVAGNRHGLYPQLSPRRSGYMDVGDGHRIHFQDSGNPSGKACVVLHGGPGSGASPTLRRLHDPDVYRIVTFDQRGCGHSTPHASLEANTTWHLVEDMEKLRVHLRIQRWQVVGGSWGSTLALAYAQRYPERVSELILRGVFLMRKEEIDWFYRHGCNALYPDAYADFISQIPMSERGDPLTAFHKRLNDPSMEVQLTAARAWSLYEGRTLSMNRSPERISMFGSDSYARAFARIETHYFMNGGFFEWDGALLDGVDGIRHIPTHVVHGRFDVITPLKNAWDLKERWPEAELFVIDDAGHAVSEPGIVDAIVKSTMHFADR